MSHQNIVPFAFEGNPVRVLNRDGDPWFVAADVAKVLDVGRTDDAVRRLDDDEKGADTIRTPGGDQQMVVINESGLYSLILTSRKPAAKRFKKWVTAEVLPSIRKTGGYGAAHDPMAILDDPAAMRGLLLTYTEKVIALQHDLDEVKPKVAGFDRIAGSDGLLNLSHAAKVLGQPPHAFNKRLRDMRWMYKRPGSRNWTAYQDKIISGLLDHKAYTGTKEDGTEFVKDQVMVTPKGLAKLSIALGANPQAAEA